MRPPSGALTGHELQIMHILWQRREATVRDVYETLLARRKIAYTTVMTMMRILERKGHLKRAGGDRAFVYKPARPKEQVIRSLVREFVERVFHGAAEPLVLHLVEQEKLSEKDLRDIARKAGRKP